jgi:hypothetical protein
LLKSAKEKFATLSLSGLKFNKSDFLDDAKKLWKGISENTQGNEPSYFEKINVSPDTPTFQRNDISAFYVTDLMEGSIEIGRMSTESNKIYITEDFNHLKRAYQKWGEIKFPVFHKVGNAYQQYTDEKTGSKRVGSSDLRDLHSEITILKDDMQQTRRGISKKLDDLSKEVMIWKFASIVLACTFLIYVAFPFISPKQYAINDDEIAQIKGYIDHQNDSTRAVLDSLQDESNTRVSTTSISDITPDYPEANKEERKPANNNENDTVNKANDEDKSTNQVKKK